MSKNNFKFKIISLNVKGISNFKKRRTIYTWCRSRKADIIFLQETHSKKETEIQWKNEWGGKMLFSHGSSNSCGTAILIKNTINYTIISTLSDPLGRYLISKIQIDDKIYVFANVYAPNKDKDSIQFFKKLCTLFCTDDLQCEDNIILGGDFNCPLNPSLDKRGGIMIPRKNVIEAIECLRDELDLVDIWRVKNPEMKSYTWSQKSPAIFCRLDYWLISNSLCDCVQSTSIIPAVKTDHAAIDLCVSDIRDELKGPGMWKMNVSLLNDENYLKDLEQSLPKWKQEGEELSNKRGLWDWIKYNIRMHAIRYSKEKAKQRNEEEKELQNKYEIATKLYENDPNDINRARVDDIKGKMEMLYVKKTEGIIIRARARWHEHGEKSSKYFLNLEKRNHVKKHIRKLLINGSITTDPFSILSEQKLFYNNLYKTRTDDNVDNENIKKFLNKLTIPQLSEEMKQSCEGAITMEECKSSLESFQNNKSPGNDGIPIEFYKTCWNLICDPFMDCAIESFEKEEMSNSQKQAVITLIEKTGKDRTLLENWRPISLLNVDAKIISKVIANRIRNVLPNIIYHNQTGYVKDRFIGETIRSILDVMEFTKKENLPGLLIFIDFQKAFDTLEWNFLSQCLSFFNFGPDFMRWIRTFYKHIQSCVINNGLSSDYFYLTRGVRQGDPLSPYLFLLAVETLAIAVRENSGIKGITIEGEETKLLQYADDTTAVLSDTVSARALFKLLDLFGNLSGLRVNSSKTEGMWIGSLKIVKRSYLESNGLVAQSKLLGYFFRMMIISYMQKILLTNLIALKNKSTFGLLEGYPSTGK